MSGAGGIPTPWTSHSARCPQNNTKKAISSTKKLENTCPRALLAHIPRRHLGASPLPLILSLLRAGAPLEAPWLQPVAQVRRSSAGGVVGQGQRQGLGANLQ